MEPPSSASDVMRLTFPTGHTAPIWIRSSFSYANGNCVEVAGLSTDRIQVRDSKNPEGPMLQFTPAEWDAFLGDIRAGI